MSETNEQPCHIKGADTGELHEPHACSKCAAGCDGDSPCLVEEVQ